METPSRLVNALLWSMLALVLALLAGGLFHGAMAVEADASTGDRDVVEIKRVELFGLGNPLVRSSHTLPALFTRRPRDLSLYRLEASFDIADVNAAKLWTVYFLAMNDGGQVKINGTTVGTVETSSADTAVRHIRPYTFLIPPEALHSGRNTLETTWASNDTFMQISRVFVGPEEVVRKDFERRYFWQNTMAQVGFDFSLINAAILFGVFALRRREIKYFLMGTTALSWGLVCVAYFLPPVPVPWFIVWCLVRIVGIALVTNCIWIFLTLEVEPQNRWFPRLGVLVGAAGPVQFLIDFWVTNDIYSPTFDAYWGFVTVGLGFYPLFALLRSLYQRWEWRHVVFLIATTAGVGAGLADMVMSNTGRGVFGGLGYTAQAVSPLWFTAIGFVLVKDFVHSIRQQESMNQLMTSKLALQQAQLSALHERSLARERETTILEERQRIMQDIHDGLGSQLISSLALSERGHLNGMQTSLLLRECIDDLRLAIDSISGDDGNFGVLAGNLRFRMQPRLRAAGIALQWDVSGLCDDVVIPVSNALSLLRILQECITNTLKHAQATCIRVTMRSDQTSLVIRVEDNGVGFEPGRIRSGKGLPGLRKRAAHMGAQLQVTSHGGTAIEVSLPL